MFLTLNQAATFLKKGELVAFPTETVYGLGACAFNQIAIQKIYRVKGRPQDNPLIVHISDVEQVKDLASMLPETFFLLAEAFMPGPLTVILPKKACVSSVITAGLDSVAIRIPQHPLALSLLESVAQPLVAPSANLSGRPSPTKAQHVLDDFQEKIAGVIDGGTCAFGLESTVVNLCGPPTLMRLGGITKEQIESVLGHNISLSGSQDRPVSPGMKYKHYSPNAKVSVTNAFLEKRCGRRFLKDIDAHSLYAQLRACDKEGIDHLVIRPTPALFSDPALMDRLKKIGAFEEENFTH